MSGPPLVEQPALDVAPGGSANVSGPSTTAAPLLEAPLPADVPKLQMAITRNMQAVTRLDLTSLALSQRRRHLQAQIQIDQLCLFEALAEHTNFGSLVSAIGHSLELADGGAALPGAALGTAASHGALDISPILAELHARIEGGTLAEGAPLRFGSALAVRLL